MVVRLTGVIEDGNPPALTVSDPHVNLRIPRGTSLTVLLAIVSRAGVPIPASSIDTATLTIKRSPQVPLIQKTGAAEPAEGVNVFRFDLSASDMSSVIDPVGLGGRFLVDAKIARGAVVDFPLPMSALFIEPTVGS
jgi:hypothetical protein